jgi:RNA polymerase sigma-70 factor (ECF subfamily)
MNGTEELMSVSKVINDCGSGSEYTGFELDAELFAAAQHGSAAAQNTLVRTFTPRIYNYLLQLSRDSHDTEDLVQETFIKALRALSSCRSFDTFPSWLFTIARRTALNHFRSRRASEVLDPELPDPGADPAQNLEGVDRAASLWTLARGLSDTLFEVLWLRYADDLSIEEIARVTHSPGVVVRVRLHRARVRLLKLVQRHGFHETL